MNTPTSIDSTVLDALPVSELIARLRKACAELPQDHNLAGFLQFKDGGFIRPDGRRLAVYLAKFGKPSNPRDYNAADLNYLIAVEAANRKG